jgi:putative flippase GtrA
VGILNSSITLIIIFLLKWGMNFGDVFANLAGYIIGLIFSFILNNKWTFNFKENSYYIYLKFLLIFVLAYLFNLVTVLICIYLINLDSYFSHALGVPAYTIVGYLGNRYYVFK